MSQSHVVPLWVGAVPSTSLGLGINHSHLLPPTLALSLGTESSQEPPQAVRA